MMPGGIHPVERAVQHVREGGERVPVVRMDMAESPDEAARAEAGSDIPIVVHIGVVVKVHESPIPGFPEHRQHQGSEGEANQGYG